MCTRAPCSPRGAFLIEAFSASTKPLRGRSSIVTENVRSSRQISFSPRSAAVRTYENVCSSCSIVRIPIPAAYTIAERLFTIPLYIALLYNQPVDEVVKDVTIMRVPVERDLRSGHS